MGPIQLKQIIEKYAFTLSNRQAVAPMTSQGSDTQTFRVNAFGQFDPTFNREAGIAFNFDRIAIL